MTKGCLWQARVLALLASLLLSWTAQGEEASPGLPEAAIVAAIEAGAQPLTKSARDYDRLLESIAERTVVMLGEATHGSSEFYHERARLTRRLIAEKGFRAVVLEAGWAASARIDAFVHPSSKRSSAAQALQAFRGFPRWVWRNESFARFLEELRAVNHDLPGEEEQISLYGMDLYEVPEAIRGVLKFLTLRHPRAVAPTRRDYRCFAPYLRAGRDPQLYGRDVVRGTMPSCERRVRHRLRWMSGVRVHDPSPAAFAAWMSARAIAGAEAYYRTLYRLGAVPSWNLRERFMAESIRLLLDQHRKLIVWAHNTHQGDARATDQGQVGELSLGQLMREELGDDAVYLVGLTTFTGRVRAASGWATRDESKILRRAAAGSWPQLLHRSGLPALLLIFRDNAELVDGLDHSLLDRAVGVTYLPEAELENHYWRSWPAKRFDALIFIDETSAVVPLR